MLACSSTSAAQERVSFTTGDGGVVSAVTYGSGSRGIVLVHGGRFDASSWARQAPVIAAAGFSVLAIDMRGRGRSGGGSAGPDSMHLDVLAGVRHLRESGARSIALIGASIGGWAAAEAVMAASPGEIQSLVLLAHASVDQPERLSGRKLFIVSRGDTRSEGTIPRLPEIREHYERAPEPKELLVLDGAAHAQLIFETEQADRLLGEILRFLSVQLALPQSSPTPCQSLLSGCPESSSSLR